MGLAYKRNGKSMNDGGTIHLTEFEYEFAC